MLLLGVLPVLLLCSCGKVSPRVVAYEPAADPDPERAQENQIRQLLVRVNSRQAEVVALARVAANNTNFTAGERARAERDKFYSADKYIESLRDTQNAITNKMAAMALERAVLANATETNTLTATASQPTATNRVTADDRTEELKLKEKLIDLQTLSEDLLLTTPSASQVNAQTREKAAFAREDVHSSQDYIARLSLTVILLQKKLQGLDAEAAVYEKALGL